MRIIPWMLATAAAAAPLAARDRDVRAATPTGPAISCVHLSQIRQTRVRSDQVIDFEMLGGKVYRNTLPYACPRLGFEERFAYTVSTGELCSVDTIAVLDVDGRPGPRCGLGQFQPVALAK